MAVKTNWSHRGSQSDTMQTSKVFFGVDLFCYYHLHSTQKMRNDERVHVINNKRDADNKPISEERHWWFVIFFRSTVQMTSDEMNTKKQTCSFYFLWSQVMTHLYSLLFYIRLLFILRYLVGFQLTQKHIQYNKQTSCTQIYHLVCLNLFVFVGVFFSFWVVNHQLVYFVDLMELWADMLLMLVLFWSHFNIHYLDSALCVRLSLHTHTHTHVLSNCGVSSVAKKTLPSLHLSDSHAHTYQCKPEHNKREKEVTAMQNITIKGTTW